MGQRNDAHLLSGAIAFDDSCFGAPAIGEKRGRDMEKAKAPAALSLQESGNPF